MSSVEKKQNNLQKTVHDSYIFGTSITIRNVERHLQESFNTTARFDNDLEITRIGVGEGYLSVIARIHPCWIPEIDYLPKTVIVKIPTVLTYKQMLQASQTDDTQEQIAEKINLTLQKLQSFLLQAHNCEVSFYEFVRNQNIGIPIPKTYFCQPFTDTCKQGLLLIEDAGENAKSINPFEKIAIDEVKQVLSVLAKIQAFSMKNPDKISIGNCSIVKIFTKEIAKKMFLKSRENLTSIDPETFTDIYNRLEPYVDVFFDEKLMDEINALYNLPQVLVHGDLWSSNVLWTERDGKRKLRAIIDWQMSHNGCAVEDICRYLCSALSTEQRRRHFNELLSYFYEEAEKYYGCQLPYRLEQLIDAVLRILPCTILIIMPFFNKRFTAAVQKKFVNREDELMLALKEKALGLLEDLLHYSRND